MRAPRPDSRRTTRRPDRSGLSLVDLSMALLVSAVLLAVATPKFFESLDSQRSLAAARRLAADVRYARQRAIAGSTSQIVRFGTSSGSTYSYQLDGIPDPDNPERTWAIDLSESPWKARLTAATAGTNSVLTFDINGNPNNAGTVTVASGSSSRKVTIASTGKVSAP